jgi:hypothetical protein
MDSLSADLVIRIHAFVVGSLSSLLGGLHDQSLVDVGNHTTTGDGGLDEGVELLISADGQLQVSGRDSLDLKVLGCVSCQLENLSGEILKDSSAVDC